MRTTSNARTNLKKRREKERELIAYCIFMSQKQGCLCFKHIDNSNKLSVTNTISSHHIAFNVFTFFNTPSQMHIVMCVSFPNIQ